MFVACGIWCLADVSSVSPSSEQDWGTYHINFVDQTHIYLIICFVIIVRDMSAVFLRCLVE